MKLPHSNATLKEVHETTVSQVGTMARGLEYSQHGVAGFLAAAADFGAYPAVLVVGGVPLALLRAQTACFGASLERGPRHLGLEIGLAGEDPARGVAHVGAVEVEPYAAGERLGVVLTEAGVGAGGAALGAVQASLDALNERLGVQRRGARVSLKHLLSVGHDASFL